MGTALTDDFGGNSLSRIVSAQPENDVMAIAEPSRESALARVANIERSMAVLEALAGVSHGKTVGELAASSRLPKSAVSRILGTLEAEGYVLRDPASNRFRISLKLLALAYRHADCLGIEDICLPAMRRLAQETGELVQLALVDGDELRFVLKAEGDRRVRTVSLMGTRAVLHATAAGKVWLASLPWQRALELALREGFEPLTAKSITAVDELTAELERVRELGYALNLAEHTAEVNSIAVPIRSARMGGAVMGAVVLTGPEFRMTEERLIARAPDLMEIGKELGQSLPADFVRLTPRS